MAANTAIALLGLLGGFFVRPIAQDYLPQVVQQYLPVKALVAGPVEIPFRVEYLPTRTIPQFLPPSSVIETPDAGEENLQFWITLGIFVSIAIIGSFAFTRWSQLQQTANDLEQSLDEERVAKPQVDEQLTSLKQDLNRATRQVSELQTNVTQLEEACQKLRADLKTEAGIKGHADNQIESLKKTLSSKDGQISTLQSDKDRMVAELDSLKANVKKEAQAEADRILGGVWDNMKVKEDEMQADIERLKATNVYFKSLLCKTCRCKLPGGFSGSDDDGHDDNGSGGRGEGPDPGFDHGNAADDAAGNPKSSTQKDGGLPRDNDSNADFAAKDSQSQQEPSEYPQTGADLYADDAAEDFDSNEDSADTATNDDGNTDVPKVVLPPTSPPKCPLGSSHTGCTTMFIDAPGYASFTTAKKRRYQRKFRADRDKLGCAYAVFAQLHPDEPIPN